MRNLKNILTGILIGIINVVIGACGGIVAVEALKRSGLNQTKAHATAISIILPLSLISTAVYLYKGHTMISDSYIFIIPGVVGALIGAHFLTKITPKVLGKAFSIFMIYAGIRMLLK